MKRDQVEILAVEWYSLPLVRLTCPRCGERGPWCGEMAYLMLFDIMHSCAGRLVEEPAWQPS